MPLAGSDFTFFEGGARIARSRLNRFLVRDRDSGWLDEVVQQVLSKFSSDHLPIMLSSGVVSSGPQTI